MQKSIAHLLFFISYVFILQKHDPKHGAVIKNTK